MQRVLAHEAAHRGHGGRRAEKDGGRGLFSYPQYTRFSAFVQPLKRLARRPMLRVALALAGDWLAGVSLRWECEL